VTECKTRESNTWDDPRVSYSSRSKRIAQHTQAHVALTCILMVYQNNIESMETVLKVRSLYNLS
jgi:hypothetical protein